MKHITSVLILAVVCGNILVFGDERHDHSQPVQTQSAQTNKELQVAPVDWTPKLIEQEIRKAFPETPERMVQIARCESKLNPKAKGPTNDHGLFQIHLPAHRGSLNGIDLYDPRENIAFARKLYDQNKLTPWNSSRHCWAV